MVQSIREDLVNVSFGIMFRQCLGSDFIHMCFSHSSNVVFEAN